MKKIICVLTLIMTVLGGGINIFAATIPNGVERT